MKGVARFAPAGVFLLLIAVFVWRLTHPPDAAVRSQLANRPVPAFSLPAAVAGKLGASSGDLARGKPHLVNLFASWCVPCIAEAPLLLRLKGEGVPIVGVAVRDRPEALAAFLAQHGDPFVAVGNDSASEVQLALGSAGVPETFVVDGRGIVRRQFIGGLDANSLPEIRRALAEAAR